MASRRQNSSCDQCRHSKRKCAFPGIPSGPGNSCLNCSHLGYKCTFEFVTARAEQKRKRLVESQGKLGTSRGIRQSQDQPVSSLYNDLSGGHPTQVIGESNTYDALSTDLDGGMSIDFGILNNNSEEWPIVTGELPDAATSSWITRPSISSPRHLRVNEMGLSGFWSGSPIRLLNSTFTRSLLGDCLDDVYKSMMYGMESRYLTYTCNPFAPSQEYYFGDEDQSTSEQGSSDINPGLSPNLITVNGTMQNFSTTPESLAPFDFIDLPGSPKRSGQRATKVTFVGLARFLDHFGSLYGNRLDKQTKKEDEETLIAAQQAFALQWSPSDTPGTQYFGSKDEKGHTTNNSQVFNTAWFNVRARILNSKPHRSFMSVYAMLLFHMTNAPEEAKDAPMEKDNILGQSLHQLLDLKVLVEDYCKHLDVTSTYRMLLESSIKVFQWFAYIKDTMASIVSDREFLLPDAPVKSMDIFSSVPPMIGWSNQSFNDAEVFQICQKAVSHNFRLLRQIVRVKKIIHQAQQMVDHSTLASALDTGISIVEDFELSYGPFCQQCMSNFLNLSESSKLSYGFLTLFWTLGVLSLVEQVQAAHNLGLISQNCDAFLKACEYEEAAISSGIAISKHIASISANGAIRVSSGSVVKLPFISHHANLAPIVEVLIKTIQHIIQRNTSTRRLFDESTAEETQSMLMEDWIPSIKPLLSCLVDFDTTVAGSQTVRVSLQKLMSTYGDILMDCWAADEPEPISNWTP